MRTLVLCAVACCYHVTFVVSFAFFFSTGICPHLWHYFYPMSHLSQETMSPQKRRLTKAVVGTDLGWGQWSRSESWMCTLLHGLSYRVNSPCLPPAWWLCWRCCCWSLWLYFCFHVWHQHSGADEVCDHPCFSMFLLRTTYGFYQCIIWKQMDPFQDTEAPWRVEKNLYKVKSLNSVYFNPWWW